MRGPNYGGTNYTEKDDYSVSLSVAHGKPQKCETENRHYTGCPNKK